MNWYKISQHSPSVYRVLIITAEGSSSGSYGYGDDSDISAPNPAGNANWAILFEEKAIPLLRGKRIEVEMEQAGSYHERWFHLKAYVILNTSREKEQLDEMIVEHDNYYGFDVRKREHIDTIQFTTLSDVMKRLHELAETEASMDDPLDDTSEGYWQRMIQSYLAGQRRNTDDTHDESDDYWKH